MYCLWNGEYGEHDLSFAPSLETTLKIQEEQYKQYVGCVVGDWTYLKVEYDWGRRDQRWTIRCNLCGKVSYQYHTQDWRRGKGRKLTCDCRKKAAELEKEKKRLEKQTALENKKKEHIGKVYHGWKVLDYGGFKNCRAKCVECGMVRKSVNLEALINGDVYPCNHKEPPNYSEPQYVGKKYGSLTVLKYENGLFRCKCDCGREKNVKPTFLVREIVKTCAHPDCEYHRKFLMLNGKLFARERREKGIRFEKEYANHLKRNGYEVSLTPQSGDFGVDCIAVKDDVKIAIQCKRNKDDIGVSAVQAVFAGGQLYGCNQFEVVCTSGYTIAAKKMADALGVRLVEVTGELSEKQLNDRSLYWTIDGITKKANDWCEQYGISHSSVNSRMKRGMTLKEALTAPNQKEKMVWEIDGISKPATEWCEQYGVSLPFVQYRIKKMGMTPLEALTAPKAHTNGRPKKRAAASPSDKDTDATTRPPATEATEAEIIISLHDKTVKMTL